MSFNILFFWMASLTNFSILMIKIPTDRKYPIKHKLAFASDKIFQITPKIRLILFTVLVFYLSSAHNHRRF